MSLSVDEIERTMNTYHTAWLVCMIAACVFLVAAVVLFIVFRIPRVFMNLTGIERKRQIKEITENVGTEAQTARHKSVQKRKTVQPEPPGVQQNSAYQMNAGQMQTTMLAGQNSSNIVRLSSWQILKTLYCYQTMAVVQGRLMFWLPKQSRRSQQEAVCSI